MLIAHRGFRNFDQENRPIDFEKALKVTTAVEFDIRLTKDNQVIIFHDHNFKRIGKFSQRVIKMTYQEIQAIQYFINNPAWLPMLLSDFRKTFAHQYDLINLEIKADVYTSAQFQIILQSIQEFRYFKAEIIVSSFSPQIQNAILSLGPRFKTGYLFKKMSHFNILTAQKFDYLHPHLKVINRRKNVNFFQSFNKPMNPYTYQKNSQAQKSYNFYGKLINGYISDNSNLLIL